MKLSGKSITTAIFALASAAAIISFSYKPQETFAATTSEINAQSVFFKQQEYDTCTLCANVMLLRRAALLRGDSNWAYTTEYSAKPYIWTSGGMYWEYTYNGFSVKGQRFGYNVKSQLIELLKDHPEGIVAYDYDRPHAVLVTDYTNGEFYCAEPANHIAPGRIKASQASINIEYCEAFWYISNASLKVSDEEKKDVIKETVVDQYWKVTANSGLNLRSGAGTGYKTLKTIPNESVIHVTKTVSDGNNLWGYTEYNSTSGWVSLNYAKRVPAGEITFFSTVTASEITLGETVKLKAYARGGSGDFLYAFYFKKNSSSNWIMIKDYSNNCIVPFQPSSASEYTLLIKAKDSKGQVVKKTYPLSVRKTLSNVSPVPAEEAYTGSSITLKAASTGGSGNIQYAYYFKRPSDSEWVTIKGYSDSKREMFTPLTVCEYTFMIKAKDENGNVSKKVFKVVVKRALTNTSSVSAKKVKLGSAVTMNGSAVGGSGSYQYAYYYKRSDNSDWVTIRTYSDSTSVLFIPSKAGEYELLIKVTDSEGSVAKKYFNLTVS